MMPVNEISVEAVAQVVFPQALVCLEKYSWVLYQKSHQICIEKLPSFLLPTLLEIVILFQCSYFSPIWNPLFVIVSVDWFTTVDIFLFIISPDWNKNIK